MNEMWRYYGVLGPLIWAYTVMANSKGDTIRNVWIGYAVLGALLGAAGIKRRVDVFDSVKDDKAKFETKKAY